MKTETPKILVAALNWGLGHASRCIPLIRHLIEQGVKVELASDGDAYRLLSEEFPDLPLHILPSYRIRYKTSNMIRNMASQLPRMLYAIRSEQWAVEQLVKSRGITAIISDNRYGCFSAGARNIVLTHQLHLKIPQAALQWVANRLLRFALSKFDEIWVPDAEGENNLAGELAHPPFETPPVRYLGPITRMIPRESPVLYDVAVVLSGPEPQRGILEQKLLEQAMSLPYRFYFVQGKPKRKRHEFVADHIEMVSHLASDELNELISRARWIVCRAGYSSVMDLAALQKKALFVPTPGQTEQEYLADRLSQFGYFATQSQADLQLEKGLSVLEETTGFPADQCDFSHYKSSINAWLTTL